ncbi:hypothetical protein [Rhizobium sp. 18065]|uniref:hypothetical protein n=1 Tax=Rhizobium sp. 18065 TaxID=2681411 RepID=UPI00190F433C|nr:hypothetical protein [Rhizobium sp. 18065]
MPTLFRFLFICATIAGIIYAIMWSLTVFVEPRQRDVTIKIPSERVNPVEQQR